MVSRFDLVEFLAGEFHFNAVEESFLASQGDRNQSLGAERRYNENEKCYSKMPSSKLCQLSNDEYNSSK